MTDLRIFKDTDGNDIELDRRRVLGAELMVNYPLDQDGAEPRLAVMFKPSVWAVDEGDEPFPTTVDIRSDADDFATWSGKPVGECDFGDELAYGAGA